GREVGVIGGLEREVIFARFSNDGKRLFTLMGDHNVRTWEVTADDKGDPGLRPLATLESHSDRYFVLDPHLAARAGFSPDGKRTAAIGRADLRGGSAGIWDTDTGMQMLRLPGHEGPLPSAAFSPDGARVLTASFDGPARLWDAATGKELL